MLKYNDSSNVTDGKVHVKNKIGKIIIILIVSCFSMGLQAQTKCDCSTVEDCHKAAKQGHVEAQLILAGWYSSGEGVTEDLTQAAYWLQKAAEQGHIDAQYFLGLCYSSGRGVTKDYAQAIYWIRKAAEQGHAKAQEAEQNVQRIQQLEKEKETRYYLTCTVEDCYKAARQGIKDAQYNLGMRYSVGKDVTKDLTQAVYWIQKAAEQGHVEAQELLQNAQQSKKEIDQQKQGGNTIISTIKLGKEQHQYVYVNGELIEHTIQPEEQVEPQIEQNAEKIDSATSIDWGSFWSTVGNVAVIILKIILGIIVIIAIVAVVYIIILWFKGGDSNGSTISGETHALDY